MQFSEKKNHPREGDEKKIAPLSDDPPPDKTSYPQSNGAEWCVPQGGTNLERGMGMCRGHDPFFQARRRSLIYHQCAAHINRIFNF